MSTPDANAQEVVEAYLYRKRCTSQLEDANKRVNDTQSALNRAVKTRETLKAKYDLVKDHSAKCTASVEELNERVTECQAMFDAELALSTMWDGMVKYAKFYADHHPQDHVDLEYIEQGRAKQRKNFERKQYHLQDTLDELDEAREKKRDADKHVAKIYTDFMRAEAEFQATKHHASQANHELAEARTQLKFSTPDLILQLEDTSGPAHSKRRKIDHDPKAYNAARHLLGRVLLSDEIADVDMKKQTPEIVFNNDLAAFMRQNGHKLSQRMKDKRFQVFATVLKNGGIENVIRNRKLGAVVTQITNTIGGKRISPSVLREVCTHEFYLYEQKLVHNRAVPQDEWQTVKMLHTRRM